MKRDKGTIGVPSLTQNPKLRLCLPGFFVIHFAITTSRIAATLSIIRSV